MTDRPIIFSAPMVRTLLEGRKTQTRRIFKLPTKGEYVRKDMGGWAPTTIGGGGTFTVGKSGERIPYPEKIGIWNQTTGTCVVAPFQPGDRLWVRETWIASGTGVWTIADARKRIAKDQRIRYRADSGNGPWWSPVHLPREFSRIALTVADVRVQRLQDISEQDAEAEGALRMVMDDDARFYESERGTFKVGFAGIWAHINGAESWDENPWIVALTFQVHKSNIDALKEREVA